MYTVAQACSRGALCIYLFYHGEATTNLNRIRERARSSGPWDAWTKRGEVRIPEGLSSDASVADRFACVIPCL